MTDVRQPKQFGKKDIREIVRSEIRDHEMTNYFMSLITGNDFETKVKGIVLASLHNKIPDEVANYLARNLSGQVKAKVLESFHDLFPTLIAPLVKAHMIEHLQKESGTKELLDDHKYLIQGLLTKEETKFQQNMNDHFTKLESSRISELLSFESTAKHAAQKIVDDLVAANGGVLMGFKLELERTNGANFESHLKLARQEMEAFKTTVGWTVGSLVLGLVACVGYIIYHKM